MLLCVVRRVMCVVCCAFMRNAFLYIPCCVMPCGVFCVCAYCVCCFVLYATYVLV